MARGRFRAGWIFVEEYGLGEVHWIYAVSSGRLGVLRAEQSGGVDWECRMLDLMEAFEGSNEGRRWKREIGASRQSDAARTALNEGQKRECCSAGLEEERSDWRI